MKRPACFAAACVLTTFGCSGDPVAVPNPATKVVETCETVADLPQMQPLEFAGKTWWITPETEPVDLLWRGRVYQGGDPSERLIEATPISNAAVVRIRRVQRKDRSGRWVHHGLEEAVSNDGSRVLANYQHGELNGERLAFYANGQMHIRSNYVGGKEHGRSQGWHENGQLQYDCEYLAGVEIQGRCFDERGNLISSSVQEELLAPVSDPAKMEE